MAEVSKSVEQSTLEADLRTNWRWLSVLAIERSMNRLIVTLQDDQQPLDKFGFEWNEVVAYAVRNESTSIFEEGGEGGPYKQFTGTRFLAWAAEATWHHEEKPLIHWQIAGSDDVIDVASIEPPVICKVA